MLDLLSSDELTLNWLYNNKICSLVWVKTLVTAKNEVTIFKFKIKYLLLSKFANCDNQLKS